MLNSDDLAQMRADLLTVRDDHAVSIVIRRGTTTLAAQTVRVAQAGSRRQWSKSGQAKESNSNLLVLGDVNFDVQPEDRFTLSGLLYKVIHVQPNEMAATTAEAEVAE